jgi:O-antigen/teichoic acid export membrane protein
MFLDKFEAFFRFLNGTDGSLQKRAIRSGAWVTLSSVGITVLSFLRSVILARLLTPEIFGLMSICSMAFRALEIFSETGFGAALIHRQKSFEEARDTAFTLLVIRGFLLAVVSFAVAPFVAAFYEQDVLDAMIKVVGIAFILGGFKNINTIALQKELDFKRLAYMEQGTAALNFVVAISLAAWFRSVWALVIAQVAGTLISVLLSFWMIPGRAHFRFDRTIAAELFSYGKFMTGLAIVVFLTLELDNALIGKVLGMEALGYYVVAYTLANLPSTHISKLVSRVMFPLFSKLQNDKPALQTEYIRGTRLILMGVIPLSVCITVLAEQIVSALYGERWSAAAGALQILAVFGCFRGLWMINGYLYNATGRPNLDFYLNLCRLVVMVALIYPLTVQYGIVGASVAVTVPMIVQFFGGIYMAHLFIGVSLPQVIRPLLIASVQGAVVAMILLFGKHAIPATGLFGVTLLFCLGLATWTLLNIRDIRRLIRSRKAIS